MAEFARALREVFAHAGEIGQQQHHRLRGRARATVGDEFDHARVDFVADRGDERDRQRERSVRDDALVERPQILARTTAARDDHGVDPEFFMAALDRAERAGDFVGRAVALHAHADHDELDRRATLARGLEHILQRGARGACDHRHATRERGQRLLALLGEIAERAEFLHELLEAQFKGADALRLDLARVELRAPLRGIVADAAGDDDRVALARVVGGTRGVALPHHAREHGACVLDREVPVPALGDVGDLALDAEVAAHAVLERARDELVELRDGEVGGRGARGGRRGSGL